MCKDVVVAIGEVVRYLTNSHHHILVTITS